MGITELAQLYGPNITPSQRILHRVDSLDFVPAAPQRQISRSLQTKTTLEKKRKNFELPVSKITPRVNTSGGVQQSHFHNFTRDWFPLVTDEGNTHGFSTSEKASTSGGKNLLDAFNDEDETRIEHMPGYEQFVSDDDDDNIDAQLHVHRGEYLSDDETDCQEELKDLWNDYMDLGPPSKKCEKCSDVLDPEIVEGLLKMLDENNKLAEGFDYARDRLNLPETDEFSLLLVSSKSSSGRPNQVGPSNKVAALVVGDSDDTCSFRDIGDTNTGNKGKNVILPATHIGSQRYMNQYFKDSLAICRTIGHPSLFFTMTYNTQWPEIKRMMEYFPGVDVADKPDVIARVFKLKLDQLLDLIKNKNYFVMHVIEFQKRGLPHCHMLIWLNPRDRPKNIEDIDKYNGNTYFDDCGFPVIDEIKHFLDGHYICASEASWRLLGFDIHHRYPTVECLPVHLEGEKNVSFKQNDNLKDVVDKAKRRYTKLEGWFEANKTFSEARQYTYHQFPQPFTWKADQNRWKIRERGIVFGRLTDVHASSGETFFLRMILMHNRGATSYKDLRTVNGYIYSTFKEACDALDLLKDDRQWHVTMFENVVHAMPHQLRQLFVFILSNNQVADPVKLWEQHWNFMSEDVLYYRRPKTEIKKLFNDVGKRLRDFNTLPFPDDSFLHIVENKLITEKHDYDSVDNKKGGIFFVYGSGGCGKTFLWNTLCCKLHSVGKIVLPVASSGIAATLLPGERTAQSRFHIPLKLDQHSVAGIKHGSELGELMKQTSLIIWDEAPMQHRHSFESVDRSLRDIMSSVDPSRAGIPFGGITIVFDEDF
ncbi:uncharacterized protein LOC141692109 [Apium graveolens]|uniref:uncharacterized protein LOC141692109 n=1 Tax=Apium graveolens TaxID=4045 RepID=UPI003D7AFCF9